MTVVVSMVEENMTVVLSKVVVSRVEANMEVVVSRVVVEVRTLPHSTVRRSQGDTRKPQLSRLTMPTFWILFKVTTKNTIFRNKSLHRITVTHNNSQADELILKNSHRLPIAEQPQRQGIHCVSGEKNF